MLRVISFLMLLALVPQISIAQEIVELNEADIELIKTIDRKERAAKATKNILAFSPLTLLLSSGSMKDFTFTFLTTDFAAHAKSINDMDKVKSCAISKDIQLHLLSRSAGSAFDFFQKLDNSYSQAC